MIQSNNKMLSNFEENERERESFQLKTQCFVHCSQYLLLILKGNFNFLVKIKR